MKDLVLGASGRLGRHVVNNRIDRGEQVRAFIHHQNLLASHHLLELVRGDVHDSADLENAVRGVDTLIATLGSASAPVKDVSSSAT
jgi:putative NADH-flavin reductase